MVEAIDPNLLANSKEAGSEIIQSVVSGLSPQLAPVIGIFKAVGIVFLIYLIMSRMSCHS